jgi:tetratricopeptide (TPR) repeat protein
MSKKKKTLPAAAPVEAPAAPAAPLAGPTAPTAAPWWQNPLLQGALIFVAALLAFWPALQNGFLSFDDGETIYYNKTIQNPTLSGLLTARIVGMYVPVSAMLYALVYQLAGESAYAFHAASLLLHAVASVLGFVLLRRLALPDAVAFFAALVAAVHPIKAEPVCWVAAQTTLVFSVFYLAALISWVNFRRLGQPRWRWGALLFFLLAALSKSAAITLPLLLPVLDWYLGVHERRIRLKNYAYLLPFFAVSVALGFYTFVTRAAHGAEIAVNNTQYNLLDRLLMVGQTLLFYPFKMLFPLQLSVNYPMFKTDGAWSWDYYAALPVLAVLGWLLLKNARKQPEWLLSAALYLLPLSIMLPFFSVGSFEMKNDRYMYLPALGFFLALVWATHRLAPRLVPLLWGLLALLFAFLAQRQCAVWKNDQTCFQHCVDLYPESTICNCNVAYGALLNRDFESSIRYYTRTLAMDSTYYECYNGRGQAYLNTRRIPEALQDFSKSIQIGFATPKLFLNHGKCLVMLNRPAEALPSLNRSLELEPQAAETHYFRAVAREKTGDPAAAIEDYGNAIRLNPNYVEALVNRAQLHYQAGVFDRALADNSAALAVAAPAVQPMILANRANAYLQSGRLAEALADAERALQLNPNYARAQQTRAAVQQAMGGR